MLDRAAGVDQHVPKVSCVAGNCGDPAAKSEDVRAASAVGRSTCGRRRHHKGTGSDNEDYVMPDEPVKASETGR